MQLRNLVNLHEISTIIIYIYKIYLIQYSPLHPRLYTHAHVFLHGTSDSIKVDHRFEMIRNGLRNR